MKKLVLIIAICSFVGCNKEETDGTAFYFDNPQPINDSELSKIPSKFIGEYSNNSDKVLIVSESAIYEQVNAMYPKKMIDSIGKFSNGKLTTYDNKVFYAEIVGDSLHIKGVFGDTIFKFSPNQKAKRINGQLVLSTKDSVFWQVKMMSLEKDSLKWKYFSYKNDYNRLKPIVKDININGDSTVIRLKPTRREFGKILELKTLGNYILFCTS